MTRLWPEPSAFLLIAITCLLPLPAIANSHPCATGKAGSGVIEGGTSLQFRLKEKNTRFRLTGLVGKTAMPDYVAGSLVRHYATRDKADRYQRHSVQVYIGEGETRWLQGELLRSGKVLFSGQASGDDCRNAFLTEEREARGHRRGLWKSQSLQFQAARVTEILGQAGQFAIVSGRVLSVGDRERLVYLNFGKNWRNDFTIIASKKGRNAYDGPIGKLTELEGKRITVRGMVGVSGGPVIRLLHTGQLEIHDD